jgi:tRNA A-37 threonylcarbamoyl transferase component Bud32
MFCSEKWTKKNKIGSGGTGIVYRICCDKNCSYVMKEIRKSHFDKKKFIKEAKIQSFLSQKGIAPTLYEFDVKKRIMIMDNLKETLRDFIIYQITSKQIFERKRDNIGKAFSKILKKLKKMAQAGIFHGDIHDGNIMRNEFGEWFFIDFDVADWKANAEQKRYMLYKLWDNLFNLGISGWKENKQNQWKPIYNEKILNVLSTSLKMIAKELDITLKTVNDIKIFNDTVGNGILNLQKTKWFQKHMKQVGDR